MIVYLFDTESGIYLNKYSPQSNPKKVGEFIYPKNSTLIKPVIKEGFVPVFDGFKWVQTPDFRGKDIIDVDTKELSVMQCLGELPENWVLYDEYKMTSEYIKWQDELKKEQIKNEILNQIEEFDLKRIRAICEPKNRDDGVSWLEFYTNKITELRKQLMEV